MPFEHLSGEGANMRAFTTYIKVGGAYRGVFRDQLRSIQRFGICVVDVRLGFGQKELSGEEVAFQLKERHTLTIPALLPPPLNQLKASILHRMRHLLVLQLSLEPFFFSHDSTEIGVGFLDADINAIRVPCPRSLLRSSEARLGHPLSV